MTRSYIELNGMLLGCTYYEQKAFRVQGVKEEQCTALVTRPLGPW